MFKPVESLNARTCLKVELLDECIGNQIGEPGSELKSYLFHNQICAEHSEVANGDWLNRVRF